MSSPSPSAPARMRAMHLTCSSELRRPYILMTRTRYVGIYRRGYAVPYPFASANPHAGTVCLHAHNPHYRSCTHDNPNTLLPSNALPARHFPHSGLPPSLLRRKTRTGCRRALAADTVPVANNATPCRMDPIHLEGPGSRWVTSNLPDWMGLGDAHCGASSRVQVVAPFVSDKSDGERWIRR